MMSNIEQQILPYLPTLLEGIITVLIGYFLKKLSVNAENIDIYKKHVLKEVQAARDAYTDSAHSTGTKIVELTNELNKVSGKFVEKVEELETIKEEDKKLHAKLAEMDKRLVKIEALLRRE